MAIGKKAGEDLPVSQEEANDISIIQAIQAYREESWQAKQDRLRKNSKNMDMYLGRQDWSHKQDGQSTEFIPKVSTSVESMCAFIKRGLVQFGDWFAIDLDRQLAGVVDGAQVREVLKCFLADLWDGNDKSKQFPTVVSDGVKVGLLESLMVFKIHGGLYHKRTPKFLPASRMTREDAELQMQEENVWRLRIDLVRFEDYYPDPSGNGLYEIHRVERDLHEVVAAAEDGLYDIEAVNRLIGMDYTMPMDEKRDEKDRNQPETTARPSFRKKVVLDEFWGTLLNSDGTVAHRNCVCTIANDKIIIRKPEDNPFWHQESPFVCMPLIRVPFSVMHKALYDHGSDLNVAINEMFNLILDGGMASVWGVRQLRIEDLEDPGQVAGGVKQGATLAVKQTLPHNAKVMEQVSTGQVPNDAMAVYEALNREYNSAVLSSELKMGQLPPKRVLATEIVESSQSQTVTLDGLIADLEIGITDIIRKSWLTILQNADDVPQNAWTSVLDKRIAMMMMKASPEERYSLFADKCQFRVFGLTATLQRAMDFQKLMALMQACGSNPLLLRSFMVKFSGDKTVRRLMRALNLNPDDVEKDMDELEQAAQEMQQTIGLAQSMNGGQGGQNPAGASAPGAKGQGGSPLGGGSSLPAEINQLTAPKSGLPANA